MRDRSMYREHRARFLRALESEGAAAVIPTAAVKLRNHDSEYPFRPDSDFWYLTGFSEPECVLVLLPSGPARELGESVLFLRDKKAEEELWTGRRLGVAAAPQALGVERAHPIEELWTRLPELLAGHERLVYRAGVDEARDRGVLQTLATLRSRGRSEKAQPAALLDPAVLLHEQRLFKGPGELELMRRAASISAQAHRAAMAAARPGMREHELDALLSYVFRRNGCTGSAYPNIVASGENACVLHYRAGNAELRPGELVLIDAGAEYDYYASDVTRTFPVDGRFTAEQRALYELVLRAQERAISALRPGVEIEALHELAARELCAGLLDLGLLSGGLDQALESKAWRRFYLHRTSHWLGLDVHDCGAYSRDGAARRLEPDMVLTVEPGLYVSKSDESVAACWRGIGIRIEDDVLVTPQGGEVLTAAVPKSVPAVEAACSAAPLVPVP